MRRLAVRGRALASPLGDPADHLPRADLRRPIATIGFLAVAQQRIRRFLAAKPRRLGQNACKLLADRADAYPLRAGDVEAQRRALAGSRSQWGARHNLGATDQKDLVEFLKALSGKYPVIEPPAP